ncbi:hypothetical protein AVEN_52326-1 [Araneus ventricosus]|uniref:RNase H type-1 domain-containing protein n=1 Tax=Araneus ventricosus TaxID=182803 RepID=A0A4Y2RXG2_ARAVE|nr:hypothetical protein AVEN_52326-1 [Araneus ventricosus]
MTLINLGHGAYTAHQARCFGQDDKCSCGKAVGTILHIVKECEIWKNQREFWPPGCMDMELKTLLELQLVRNSVIHIVEQFLTKELNDT